jgi:subtilisin family serine protease
MNTYVVFMPPQVNALEIELDASLEDRLAANDQTARQFVEEAFSVNVVGLEVSGLEISAEGDAPRYLNSLDAVIVEASDEVAAKMVAMGATVIPNFEIFGIEPIDPASVELAQPWHLDTIHVSSAWDQGFDGLGTLVGVLDTGIDADHPEFVGKNVYFQEFDSVGKPIVSAKHDAGTHGTHVCGTIAGKTVGIAPKADLAVACVLNGLLGSGTLAGIAAGINWLATTSFDGKTVDVLNASLGTKTYNAVLYPAISAVRTIQGLLTVAAIGNQGLGGINRHGSPGNYDIVLGIGATDSKDFGAPFSDWGIVTQHPGLSKPDLCAPGVGIVSSVPGGGYGTKSGTSMASPCVAGAAALVLQKYPSMRGNATSLAAKLATMVAPAFGSGGKVGSGRLDLTSL